MSIKQNHNQAQEPAPNKIIKKVITKNNAVLGSNNFSGNMDQIKLEKYHKMM